MQLQFKNCSYEHLTYNFTYTYTYTFPYFFKSSFLCLVIPVRYSMTAAMYTGEPTPIRNRCVPIFRYRCSRPTGNVTLALCDFDIAFWRFFPPLADIFIYSFVFKVAIKTAPTLNKVNTIILQYRWMATTKMILVEDLWYLR